MIWQAAMLAGVTMEGGTGEPGERTPAAVDGRTPMALPSD
jgi:hypothetical protein